MIMYTSLRVILGTGYLKVNGFKWLHSNQKENSRKPI